MIYGAFYHIEPCSHSLEFGRQVLGNLWCVTDGLSRNLFSSVQNSTSH
ncbi:hypothetical protein F383_21726 [Gossypium arboreum]|uniref:Uncharacterized protein n=1 Tax=Gossypium arboreum TaxID=29729 RepID=A0A0B0NXD2_GOSAR|nr:hypothetical protein F383_21726 [Gossypium arboreum]